MMQWILIISLVLHVLAGIAWVGMSMALARALMPMEVAMEVRPPQRNAAVVAILAGLALWWLAHRDRFNTAEMALAIGAALALAALVVQLVASGRAKQAIAGGTDEARAKVVTLDRIGAGLLIVTVILMAASKYL